MNKEITGTLLAIIAAVVSGVSIPANKVFVVNIDPIVFTAVRAIIIGIVFLVLSLATNKNKKFFSVSWKYFASIAIIGGAIAFALYFTGLKLTTAGRAAFLHKTLPLYTALLAFAFLKEKITKKYTIAIFVMFLGTIAIYSASINPTDLWSNPQLGDMLVISAAILWAVENTIVKKAMKKGETNFVVSFSRMFFGGLILFGAVILMGKTSVLMSFSMQQIINIAISTALLFAYVLFYYMSLKMINVSKATVLLLIAPVISLILGIIFLREPAPALQIAGSVIILVGAYLITGMKSEQRSDYARM
ncbi:MAG TPA: DMT family transporter [archaeon]|nr:DMT family transporter [archaeon]